MNNYTKSVDELARRKTHPKSLPAFGEQSRSQLRMQAHVNARRQLISALAVTILAAICVGYAVFRIVRAVTS